MNAPETIRPGQVRSRWQVYPTVWGVCYWACLLWLGGMLLIPRAAAFQFDVFLGYDGVVREENWFPVVCEVANDGPAFQAVFEVENSYSQSSQTRRLVLELPTNTRKRFVLPVFSSGRYSAWNARLLDERGKVRAESTGLRAQQDAQANGFLLGAVPRSFSGLPVLPGETDSRRSSQIYVCHIRPELFPDNPIALEGLNALYVDSEMALQLKPPQVEAILAWLYGGGHLIISVEQLTDVNGTPWLRSLMPCELSGTTAAFSQDDLMQWLKGDAGVAGQAPAVEAEPVPARASPRAPNRTYGITPEMARRYGLRPGLRPASSPESPPPDPFANLRPDPAFDQGSISVVTGPLRDGRVLCSMQGQPILVRADRGRGQITAILFNPEREPFRSWKNSAWFWAKTAEVPGPLLSDPNAWNSNGSSIDGIFGAMIDSKQVHKLPVPWLLALLVAYLALIGPVDRFWLRRINRQMLTWITFPIYVVLFSGLIYFIGYKLRAGESEWNELHVVDIVPRGANTDLRGRTYMSIYSPVNAKYPLASDVPFSTMRAEAQWLGSADAGSVRIDQQVHGFRATVDVPVWTSQLYVNDWWQPSAPPLSAQVVPRGTGFQVTVHNYLNRNLSRACLVLNGRVFELGLLPAQQIKSFDLDMAKGRRLLDFFANYSVDFTQAVQQRRRAFGGESTARNWDVPACVMAASFVPQIELGRQFSGGYSGGFLAPDGFDLTPLAQRGDAILLTWDAGHSLIQSIAKFDPRRSQRDTLFRLAVTVEKPAL